MKISRRRERSAPVYVDTGEGVVSLVYEVAVTEAHRGPGVSGTRIRWTVPLAMYIIDDTGVQRRSLGGRRPLLAIGAAFMLGPLQWALIGRRRQQRG